jgi:hypothetical protein
MVLAYRLHAVAPDLDGSGILAWPLRYSASVVALASSSAHGSSAGLKGLGFIAGPLGHPASVALASSPDRRGTRPL